MNTDPISIAVKAQKEGFAYITNLLNGVLPKGIRFEEGNENASLDNAMYRMRQALPALRTIYPEVFPPDDRIIYPWTLGYINGLENAPIYIGVVRDHVHDALVVMIEFLREKNWSVGQWEKCIVNPINDHQNSLITIIEEVRTMDAFNCELDVPLTDNDRSILRAMHELQCSMINLCDGQSIVEAAIVSGDTKSAFIRLKANGLVDGKPGRSGGYWLTSKGIRILRQVR